VLPLPVNVTTSACLSLYPTRAFTHCATTCLASARKHDVCDPVVDVDVCVFAYIGSTSRATHRSTARDARPLAV
jgi:hypothetical protein